MVLKITEAQPQFGRVIVADYLPAGFEIDNPHLVSSGDTGTLSWITDAVEPVNAEFRDDRFTAAFDRKKGDRAGVHRRLCGARGRARANTCGRRRASRTCTVPTASAAPRPRASKSRRRNEPTRQLRAKRSNPVWPSSGLLVASLSAMTRTCAARRYRRRVALRHRCSAPPHGGSFLSAAAARQGSRRSRPACSIATAGCCAPTPRAKAAGGLPATVADVDPRFFDVLFAYEDKRFRAHHGVDPLALAARGVAARHAAAASAPAARR